MGRSVSRYLGVCVCVYDVDATAATRQPPAAREKDATASGADAAAACAATATHPVSLHCAELPPLPLLSLLPSSLSLLAQTSHAVVCSARWGSCCGSFLSVKCPPLPAILPLSPQFPCAFLSQ